MPTVLRLLLPEMKSAVWACGNLILTDWLTVEPAIVLHESCMHAVWGLANILLHMHDGSQLPMNSLNDMHAVCSTIRMMSSCTSCDATILQPRFLTLSFNLICLSTCFDHLATPYLQVIIDFMAPSCGAWLRVYCPKVRAVGQGVH